MRLVVEILIPGYAEWEATGLVSGFILALSLVIGVGFFGLGWGVLALSDWWDSRREEKKKKMGRGLPAPPT